MAYRLDRGPEARRGGGAAGFPGERCASACAAGRPPAVHRTQGAGRAFRVRVPGAPWPSELVWSACTGAGSRPVPSRQSRKGSEQAGSGPSRIGPASATGGPGSSRLKATPAAWARFCCCRHAALGVDARRSVGRSEGPDLGRCPACSPPGEWESGTSAFSFSLLNPGGTDLVVWEAVTGPDC